MEEIASWRNIKNKTGVDPNVTSLDECPAKRELLGKKLNEKLLEGYTDNQLVMLKDVEFGSKIVASSFPGNENKDLKFENDGGLWAESTENDGTPIWICRANREIVDENTSCINIGDIIDANGEFCTLNTLGSAVLIRFDPNTMNDFVGLFALQDIDNISFAVGCISDNHFIDNSSIKHFRCEYNSLIIHYL